MQMKHDPLSPADCGLMVGLCRYYAQLLYPLSNKLDFDRRSETLLPLNNGVVPAGTVLTDGVVRNYASAASALVNCGFAKRDKDKWELYTLLVDSDRFVLDDPSMLSKLTYAQLGPALSAMFRIYDEFEVLGPPRSLQNIFDLLLEAGVTEMRHGHLEWSEKAIAAVYPRKMAGLPNPEDPFLWNTELFDWFVGEAATQWQ